MDRGPRVAILGAGSIGCFIGGTWAAAGVRVSFIGRRSFAKDLDQNGLTLTDYSGWRAHLKAGQIDYRCGPETLAEAEVVVVTVKSRDTAQAAADIVEHAEPGGLVISFQNGISNIDLLEKRLRGRFEIARGLVPYNVAYLGKGHFHKGVKGELLVEKRDGLREIADAADSSPASLKLSDEMLGLAWGKLLINLNNAVNALSGKTLRDELGFRDYRRVFAASMREGLDLLKRGGIRPAKIGPIPPRILPEVIDTPNWLFNSLIMKTWKIDAKARSSMADDLAKGRKTEIDYLNGELVQLAEHLGRKSPVNGAIVELVHEAESGAAPLSPAALRRAVLQSQR